MKSQLAGKRQVKPSLLRKWVAHAAAGPGTLLLYLHNPASAQEG